MTRRLLSVILVSVIAVQLGCTRVIEFDYQRNGELRYFKDVATEIEYPDAETCRLAEVNDTHAPRTLTNPDDQEIWNLPLEEAIKIALENSKIMRDLGGRLLNAPGSAPSTYLPAIQESDPRFGVEGALSAFDAQVSTSLFWEKNDHPQNFAASVAPLFPQIREQDLGTFQSRLSKTTATGGTWSLTGNTIYDWNNSPTNLFPSVWNTNIEAGVTQPLLQGNGVMFNRIAGPNAQPGFYNGVLIARINTDISIADFEVGVRNLVSDVENAYWDLYFAYRDLDAKIAGRDEALTTWRKTAALAKDGVSAADESLAREQYFFFRSQVENALSGVSGQSTQTGNGAGHFVGAGGVYARENNLRYLMGLSANDGRLIRPSDEPAIGRIEFDWEEILGEALCRRVELRRQKWTIQRRELELTAAKNFLMPRLDAVGRYRWLGMGDDLSSSNSAPFAGAWENMFDGNFQEWQMGLQFNMPIGFRQAMAAVRNAQLNLARERAVLEDQELQVSHDLTGSIRELDRSYQLVQTNYNRRVAAQKQVAAVQAARDATPDKIGLNVLLDAQRRLADADVAYYRSLVEYNLAVKGVHFEKGSLLDYDGVYLAEGPWPGKAYSDAERRASRRIPLRRLDYSYQRPAAVARGRVLQGNELGGMEQGEEITEGPFPASLDHGPAPTEAGPNDAPDAPPTLPTPGPEREAARPIRSTGVTPSLRKTASPKSRMAKVETKTDAAKGTTTVAAEASPAKPEVMHRDAAVMTAGGTMPTTTAVKPAGGWTSRKSSSAGATEAVEKSTGSDGAVWKTPQR